MADIDLTAILKNIIKQRNESCEVYKKAGRSELLENETKEIDVKKPPIKIKIPTIFFQCSLIIFTKVHEIIGC